MKITNETKVGALAAVAIIILIVGYSFLKGNDVFSSENDFYAKYENVEGLTASNPVLVNGFQIGRVAKLTLLSNGQILAHFKTLPEYEIPKNTIARMVSTSLLGGKAIVFELGNSNEYLTSGDTLNADMQKNFMEQVEPVQKKAEVIIQRLDSVLTSVNNTLSPQFQKNFDRSFASIARTLETLEGSTQKLDGLIGNNSARISGILANMESISANFKNNNEKITSIMTNLNSVSDQFAKANFKQTVDNANKAVADMQAAIDKVNNGKGSLALLLNDSQLYDNLNKSAENLNKLMVDLKENPKRYVSLQFSLLGGKKD